MKRILTTLLVGIMALSVLGMASASSITFTSTARDSYYRAAWGGWENPYIYLNDNEDQYVMFDIGILAGDPTVAIDSAVVSVDPGGNWNSTWGSAVGLYRATSLDLVHGYPGAYDSSVMYSQAGTSPSANMVFDATSLVQGWAAGSWSGDVVGGITLSYVTPTGNSNLIWMVSDLSGATLTVNYHAVPEPASFMALGMGVFGLLLRRRSKSA